MQKASVQNAIIADFSAHKTIRCFSAFLSPGIHDDQLKEEKRKLAKRRTKLTSESLQLPPGTSTTTKSNMDTDIDRFAKVRNSGKYHRA